MPADSSLLGAVFSLGLFIVYWAALTTQPALRPLFTMLGRLVALPLRLFVDWRRAGQEGAARLAFVADPSALDRDGQPAPLSRVADHYLYLRGAGVAIGTLAAFFTGAWILAGRTRVATEFGGITLGENVAASVPPVLQGTLYLVLLVVFTQLGWRMGQLWLSDAVIRKRRGALNELADFLDMLAVCMNAGAEFDRALEVAVIKWTGQSPAQVDTRPGRGGGRREGGWLKADLVQALIERNMGLSRAEYIANLARRALGPDAPGPALERDPRHRRVRRTREEAIWAELVRAVERSRDLGTPLQTGFAALAARIRGERFARAEESAHRASAATWLPQIFLVLSMVISMLTGVALSLVGLFATAGP